MDNDLIFGTEASDSMLAADMEGTQIAAAPQAAVAFDDALTRPFDAAQVVIPEGENVVREPVTPGEIVELPFPADSEFLARIDNGNLAIKVGDVTVILQGYVEAAGQAAPVIEASNGQPLDIATILASTDPNIDIQTAAGPAAGPQGQGADNSGGILQQFGDTAGLGGFEGAGAQDATDALAGGTVDQTGTLFRQFGLLEVNLEPTAQDETETTDEDTPFTTGQVTATDPEGDPLTYILVSGPSAAQGNLVFNPDGSWSFDPNGKFEGLNKGDSDTVTFQYKASDGTNESNVATVTINVTGVNDAPKSAGGFDGIIIPEDAKNSSQQLGWTLTDVDNAVKDLTIELLSVNPPSSNFVYDQATNTLFFNTDGKYNLKNDEHIDYTISFLVKDPDGGQTQRDVTVTITSDQPVAISDIVLTNAGPGSFDIPEWALVANDTDSDSKNLDVASKLTGPGNADDTMTHTDGAGSAGFITYTDAGALGGSFHYNATDGAAISNGLTKVTIENHAVGSDITGTVSNEILIGTTGTEKLDGGGGNDIIIGKGGNDEIFGGTGDDTLVYSAGSKYDGGTDTVADKDGLEGNASKHGDILAVHDAKLDFSDGASVANIHGIETISTAESVGGFGAQAVTIGAQAVQGLSDNSTITPGGLFPEKEAVRIDGDAVDQLYLSISKDGGNWVDTGVVNNGYHVFAHETGVGAATTDAYVMVHTNVVPNVHLNQDAP